MIQKPKYAAKTTNNNQTHKNQRQKQTQIYSEGLLNQTSCCYQPKSQSTT